MGVGPSMLPPELPEETPVDVTNHSWNVLHLNVSGGRLHEDLAGENVPMLRFRRLLLQKYLESRADQATFITCVDGIHRNTALKKLISSSLKLPDGLSKGYSWLPKSTEERLLRSTTTQRGEKGKTQASPYIFYHEKDFSLVDPSKYVLVEEDFDKSVRDWIKGRFTVGLFEHRVTNEHVVIVAWHGVHRYGDAARKWEALKGHFLSESGLKL